MCLSRKIQPLLDYDKKFISLSKESMTMIVCKLYIYALDMCMDGITNMGLPKLGDLLATKGLVIYIAQAQRV